LRLQARPGFGENALMACCVSAACFSTHLSVPAPVHGLRVPRCYGIIDGQIGTPSAYDRQPERAGETFFAPEAIAENYWLLHQQSPSAWTQELDLRPHVEKFGSVVIQYLFSRNQLIFLCTKP